MKYDLDKVCFNNLKLIKTNFVNLRKAIFGFAKAYQSLHFLNESDNFVNFKPIFKCIFSHYFLAEIAPELNFMLFIDISVLLGLKLLNVRLCYCMWLRPCKSLPLKLAPKLPPKPPPRTV